jgi:hypothetical protein
MNKLQQRKCWNFGIPERAKMLIVDILNRHLLLGGEGAAVRICPPRLRFRTFEKGFARNLHANPFLFHDKPTFLK